MNALLPDEWFHGSAVDKPFERFDHDKSKPEQGDNGSKHWNSWMGSHWTSIHRVARGVAQDHGGVMYHARLDLKNPKHYDDEREMDKAALKHHLDAGEKFVSDAGAWDGRHDRLLTEHPQSKELALRFRDHLISQGHDGVTYGNAYEPPHGHLCAIAFHPDQIHITHHHGSWDDESACDSSDEVCKECGAEQVDMMGQCQNCGRDQADYDPPPAHKTAGFAEWKRDGYPSTLPNGHKVADYGDGGSDGQYNWSLRSHDPETGEETGRLDVTAYRDENTVQWMHVPEKWRGQGVMTHLVDHFKKYRMEDGEDFNYSLATDLGGRWIDKHGSSPALPNPYHSDDDFHHTWFHGGVEHGSLDSRERYTDKDFPGPGEGFGGPQMNKLLGTHFSALRSVAKEFCKPYQDSVLYHARLRMKNPAYFPSEHDLDRAVFRHVVADHPDFTNDEDFASRMRWQGAGTPRTLAERDRQMADDHPHRTSLDQALGHIFVWHHRQREYAQSFVDHLKRQGHDGIVYGNMVEGPKFHHSAIAFDPDSIHIQDAKHLPQWGKDGHRLIPTPEHLQDNALDESDERLGDVQEQHHGSRERYDYEHSSRRNLDHGPWKPYRETSIVVPFERTAALPSGVNFSYRPVDDFGTAAGSDFHQVQAQVGGETVGHITWHPATGEIWGIGVRRSHRRRGVATALLQEAHRIADERNLMHPEHSERQTPDGEAWSSAIRSTAALGDMTDAQRQSLSEHFAEHHPHLDADGPMADWLHRSEHMNAGEKTMGPRSGQTPLFGGLGHDHDPRIDPFKPVWQRQASTLADDEDEPEDRDRDEHGECYYYPGHYHEHVNQGGDGLECPYADHYTDWGHEYPKIDSIHRGLVIDDVDSDRLHDTTLPKSERVKALTEHDFNDRLGPHWSASHEVAREYASRINRGDPSQGVVVHAEAPEYHDIEQEPENLRAGNVYGMGLHDDDEVPLRNHAPVHITGYSWLKPDQHSRTNSHLDSSWETHHLPVSMHRTASLDEQLPLHPDLPTGMPEAGITKGNPQLPIFRGLSVEHGNPLFDEDIDEGLGKSPHHDRVIADHLMGHLTAPQNDRGIRTNVGIHWTHDGEWAKDYANHYHVEYNHGSEIHRPVVVEAYHPGLEHVMSWDNPGDHKALTQTIGDRQYDQQMLGEVPVRPGAPLHIRALHVMDSTGDFHRIPVDAQHIAAVRNVSDTLSDGDGIVGGVMIAIVPPRDLAERLHIEDGEHPEQLHITLAYLGKTDEYSPEQIENLPEVVSAWVEAHEPFSATVQGVGTFVNSEEDGQHVLWASVDSPGLEARHVDLVGYLRAQGYSPHSDHVFTPHMTLAYGKNHFRFMPKIERETWLVEEIWVCTAGRWESVKIPARTNARSAVTLVPQGGPTDGDSQRHAAGRGDNRRRRDRGAPTPEQPGAPDPVGDGPPAPRTVTFHPRAEKDLSKLHKQDQRLIATTIEALSRGDKNLQTHKLIGPMAGWYSTKASRGHRVIHQDTADGGIYVGYVGLHEYGDAINRLS